MTEQEFREDVLKYLMHILAAINRTEDRLRNCPECRGVGNVNRGYGEEFCLRCNGTGHAV